MENTKKLISVVLIAFFMGLILGIIILIIQDSAKKETKIIVEEQPQINIIKQVQQDNLYQDVCYEIEKIPKKELKHEHEISGNKLPY